MNDRQNAIIKDNLRAFTSNFGDVRIESYDKRSFYVYYPVESDSYIQFCENIDYLNGWLYGVVQGAVRGEFKKYRTGVKTPFQHAKVVILADGEYTSYRSMPNETKNLLLSITDNDIESVEKAMQWVSTADFGKTYTLREAVISIKED